MKCDTVIKKFLELDNFEPIPVKIRFHILHCSKCRKEIFGLRNSFESLYNDSSFTPAMDLTEEIMMKITKLEVNYKYDISNFKWIASGLVIMSGIFLMPYSANMIWAKSQFGGNLEVPLAIVMGLVFTAYVALFAGAKLQGFKKLVKQIDKMINS